MCTPCSPVDRILASIFAIFISPFLVGYFDIPTPPDYYRAYILQLGFYLHSLWSVLFIDVWRKDSAVLLVHHFMTLFLLQFSLVLRLHRIGALVLFLHDLNDVFLEVAKVNVYVRARHGKPHAYNIWISNLFFALFTVSWIVMRLYWFPLKVLYAASWGVYITNVGRECRSFLFFNVLLWALFFMHIYWFRFIAIMAGRLILCPSSGDMREEDSDDDVLDKCNDRSGDFPVELTMTPLGGKLGEGIEPNGSYENRFAVSSDEKALLNGMLRNSRGT
ncbi:unnamed protein product [Dicrocoelium dendriticum]|nr:unnamed protein product [Dicrocoelium dendriticum]